MVHDVSSTPSSRAAFDRLLAVSILVTDDMARVLRARGLTPARANALWQVARHEALNQRQIADLLHVTPRNITKLVDELERGGFVTRTGHESDRRAVLVRLTEKGEAAAAQMESEATALAEELFGSLSPEDLTTVIRALDHVAARVSQGDTT